MKKIGILGGTNYPSTTLYYEILNKIYHEKFGGHHSCPIILYSIDYHEIKSSYSERWDIIPSLLKKELEILISLQPSCIIIANNTLHKAFDLIKNEIKTNIPVFHIIDLTKEHIQSKRYKNVLLIGTKFTMEDGYFKQPLIDDGINVVIPDEDERNEIQKIQTSVSAGDKITVEQLDYFQYLNKKYSELDAFILGCTEIPVIYQHIDTEIHLIDTLQLQCEEAMSIF